MGDGSQLDQDLVSAGAADHSAAISLAGEDGREAELSEDEDQPSFVGLFKPQLFRSLLHKAKVTTRLGSISQPSPSEGTNPDSLVPLFEEPVVETEEIPGPKLFREVLNK